MDLAHIGMTADAAVTKLRNATLDGKHATPPPTGTPEHRESAGISRKLEGKLTIEGGAEIVGRNMSTEGALPSTCGCSGDDAPVRLTPPTATNAVDSSAAAVAFSSRFLLNRMQLV